MRQAEPGKGSSSWAMSRLFPRPIRGGFPCLTFYRWLRRRAALPPAHLLSPSGTPRMAKLQGPEGRKNASPWREPWVWRCVGLLAPEGRSESAALGFVFGGTHLVLPAPAFLIAPPGLGFCFGARSPRLTPWARVLPPRPGLEIDGSWRAPCSKSTCSRTMNQERFRGARRPPLRQAGRPPLQTRGSWEAPCSKMTCSRTLNLGRRRGD